MRSDRIAIRLMCSLSAAAVLLGLANVMLGQGETKLVKAKDGSGIIGYKDTPILPWCGYHVHDPDRPAPPKVTPGQPAAVAAPSDAVVLFKGRTFRNGSLPTGRLRTVS
jgi:hypothetical protein